MMDGHFHEDAVGNGQHRIPRLKGEMWRGRVR